MMLDLAQNSPPKVKMPTPTIVVEKKQNIYQYIFKTKRIGPLPCKRHPHSMLQVPTTQLAKMSIDPEFVVPTADVLKIFL